MEDIQKVQYNYVFIDPYKNTTQVNQSIEPAMDGYREAVDGFVKMLQLVGYGVDNIDDVAEMYNKVKDEF